MPLIYQLVKTLNQPELGRVMALPLQHRERNVLMEMAALTSRVFPSSTICKKLQITSSHLDKINSTLLRKIIYCLAGDSIYEQVNFLNQKSILGNDTKKLLNFYEQKIIALSTDKEEKFKFYQFYFEWLIPIDATNEKELKVYAKKIIENCDESHIRETALWIRTALFRKKITQAAHQVLFNEPEMQQQLFVELNSIINEAEIINSAQCLFKAKLAGVVLNNLLHRFSESVLYISDINELFKQKAEQFSHHDLLVMQWHYAQKLFLSGSINESFIIYNDLFRKIDDTTTARWYIYITEYFQASLVTGNLEVAKRLCDEFYSRFCGDIHSSYYLSALVQKVKYLLFARQYEQANNRLIELHQQNSKTSSLQFQFSLRDLTLAWHYLTGNYAQSLELAEKNLKFLRSKKIHLLLPEYTYHSRLSKTIIKIRQNHRPFSESESVMFLKMQKGTLAQFGLLLLRVLTGE